MTVGIFAQYKEKNITGINRYSLGLLSDLKKLDTKNEYKFIGKTSWLPIDIETIPAFVHTDDVNDLSFTCKSNNINIVHSHYRPFKVSRNVNCGKIITIHDLIALNFPEWHKNQQYLFDKSLRKCCECSDIIIADSEATKADILKFYDVPQEKVKVIYLGLYPKESFLLSSNGKEISTLKNMPFLLSVSSIAPHKNQKGLAEAFALFKERHPNSLLKLVLTGRKRRYHVFREIIDKYPKMAEEIVFTDYVSDAELVWLYKNSLAFVYPSLIEGFGLPILEAMSIGKAVITSSVSSMPEVGGDAVAYCNPYEIESMIEMIEKICFDEGYRHELEVKAKIRASSFSYENTAKETLKIYNSFL